MPFATALARCLPSLVLISVEIAALGLTGHAAAQPYPNKPIRIIVPASPGGAIDIVSRLTALKLQDSLGQPVSVENRPGASNISGTDAVAKAAPDGYTLLMCSLSQATNPSTIKRLPYDSAKDFEPVAFTHLVPLMLVVHPSVPAKNVQELVVWLKANPDKASYASSGTGSSLHMSTELFKSMTGTKILHVPYKGSTAAHPDVISGRVSMIIDTITAILPHTKTGAVRPLAVTTARRASIAPDIPTMAESGLPGYDTSTWGGILAPAGTPKEIVNKLNAEFIKALNMPDVKSRLSESGVEIGSGSPQQFGEFIRTETVKWAKVAKDAGVVPE
ncbi:MAG: putative exported protein [Betaproteobacteria bacterium]|nr:putative exported protein [Betaproteobacteria bacterium]